MCVRMVTNVLSAEYEYIRDFKRSIKMDGFV